MGNRLTVQEPDGTRVTYGYDASFQLVNERRSGANTYNTTYSYDGVGNRLTKNASGQVTAYGYNAGNEQTLLTPPSGQPTTSSYDANGNLTLENVGGVLTTYAWDPENRLLTVAAPSAVETYSYSADGLRERKVTGAGTVFYVRDGQNVLIETDGNVLVTQAEYTDLPGMWGGKFALRRSGNSAFYVPDYQGTTRQLTNAAQAVTDTLLTDAWGVELASSGATANSFRAFGAWGYYRDAASRLYVRARHLRVDLGRWVSRDALLPDLGGVQYGYAGNNPAMRIDPTGLVTVAPVNDNSKNHPRYFGHSGGPNCCCGKFRGAWTTTVDFAPGDVIGVLVMHQTHAVNICGGDNCLHNPKEVWYCDFYEARVVTTLTNTGGDEHSFPGEPHSYGTVTSTNTLKYFSSASIFKAGLNFNTMFKDLGWTDADKPDPKTGRHVMCCDKILCGGPVCVTGPKSTCKVPDIFVKNQSDDTTNKDGVVLSSGANWTCCNTSPGPDAVDERYMACTAGHPDERVPGLQVVDSRGSGQQVDRTLGVWAWGFPFSPWYAWLLYSRTLYHRRPRTENVCHFRMA